MATNEQGFKKNTYFCTIMHNLMHCRTINSSFLKTFLYRCLLFLAGTIFCACSSSRHLKEGELLLNKVNLTSADKHVKPSDYRTHVRQEANSRWFNLSKVPLGIYNLSGRDSTRRFNRMLQRIGEAPVVYDTALTNYSRESLKAALQGKGYLHARVQADTVRKGKKVNLYYHMEPGVRSYIRSLHYEFDNDTLRRLVLADTLASLLYRGAPLDVSLLQAERNRIITTLRNKGYYRLNKEYISFRADTVALDNGAALTLCFQRPHGVNHPKDYSTYRMRRVTLHEDHDYNDPSTDSVDYRGLTYRFHDRTKVIKRVYNSKVYIRPDSLFRAVDTDNTYGALNGLSALSYSSIHYTEPDTADALLDCDIRVKTNAPHSVSAELEGTNTSGDLGAAMVFTYNNRNLFHGSENLSVKLRGAYEAITGLEGYSNENYVEYSAEVNLRFPTFMSPGLTAASRQYLNAASELSFMYDSQNRPEFHRRVVTGNWGYQWNHKQRPNLRHRIDLIGLNYVFMPKISETFRNEYLEGDDPRYAMLRSSYENMLIMKTGYSFTYNSLRSTAPAGLYQTNGYQIRFSAETAGNLLNAISHLTHAKKDKNGQYNVFNIAYSQYAKFDFDFAKSFLLNDRNSLAVHTAFGIAIPYGNSSVVPYEKRYFSGGANSVRGWSARELGPGSYVCKDGKINFINQMGNMKLDLSMELRTQLFSKFHGALFIDAGNVWNTRDYPDQPGGLFRFSTFYKQIAVAYGLGLRLNLGYFVLRLDGGMKAINPTIDTGSERFPLIHPDFGRDFTLHFAVGLPF